MKSIIRDTSFLKESLIAHRGYHNIDKKIPENSIPAFKEAIKNNLVIELDVHILKDSNVVVFHDDNLKRMTSINKNIKDLTYKDLNNVYLEGTKEKIPLLTDVLKLVNGKVPLIIELKSDVKCGLLEEKVIKILKEYKGKYAVKSFNPFSIRYFKKYYPDAIRGQLVSSFKNKKMNSIKKLFLSHMFFNFLTKPDFISYDIKSLPNNKISKLRDDKLILGWTVRNTEDLEKAKKYCDNYICENIDFKKI